MKTAEELKQLAKRVVTNEVFLTSESNIIQNSFMMILAFAEEGTFPKDTVAFYEEYSKSMPMGINGYPVFGSCGFLVKDEFMIFKEHYDKYVELFND